MSLQTPIGGPESLELVAVPSELSTIDIVRVARQTQATITRILVEGMGERALCGKRPLYQPAEPIAPADFKTKMPVMPNESLRRQGELLQPLLRLSARRLSSFAGWALLLSEPIVASLYAVMHRTVGEAWAVYDTLVFLMLVLVPLWSLAICRVMYADSVPGGDVGQLARYGGSKSVLAAIQVCWVSTVNAITAAASAALLLLILAGLGGAGISDVWPSLWIAGLGGAVYGAFAASLFVSTRTPVAGWGFLLLDFFLGGTTRALSFPFPRAHIHNLLGSASALELPQRYSSAMLGLLLFLAVGLACFRTDP
jgi:hypothetical protein